MFRFIPCRKFPFIQVSDSPKQARNFESRRESLRDVIRKLYENRKGEGPAGPAMRIHRDNSHFSADHSRTVYETEFLAAIPYHLPSKERKCTVVVVSSPFVHKIRFDVAPP